MCRTYRADARRPTDSNAQDGVLANRKVRVPWGIYLAGRSGLPEFRRYFVRVAGNRERGSEPCRLSPAVFDSDSRRSLAGAVDRPGQAIKK